MCVEWIFFFFSRVLFCFCSLNLIFNGRLFVCALERVVASIQTVEIERRAPVDDFPFFPCERNVPLTEK